MKLLVMTNLVIQFYNLVTIDLNFPLMVNFSQDAVMPMSHV